MNNLLRHLIVLAALLALAVPTAGLAAVKGTYKGETTQNRPVTFKVKKGKVKGFVGGVTMFCTGMGFQFNAAIPPKAMKLKKGRKFSYNGPDKSNSVNIVIKGRLKGKKAKKATGKVEMNDAVYNGSTGTFSTCSGTAKFTAKKQ